MTPRVVILFATALLLAGCRSAQPDHHTSIQRGPVPTYSEVAAAYNARVTPLTRLSAGVVLRLKYVDEDGQPHQDQVEGHCDFVAPRNVLLRLDKAGVPIAMLGSNDTQYWWIDLSERKRALVGDHDKAAADRLSDAGVPVHPLDLIQLLCVTPLPEGEQPSSRRAAWSADGKDLIVTVPGRFGTLRLFINPGDYRPHRAELLGDKDELAATSDLSKYESVSIRSAGPGVVHPLIATDVQIVASHGQTQGHLELSSPEIDPRRPSSAAFDLQHLLELKGVQDVHRLDTPELRK